MGLLPLVFAKKLLGHKNPYKAAAPHLANIEPQQRAAYEPYINRGNEASAATFGAYQRMLQDPYAFENEIYQHYRPSEGYGRKYKQLMNEARSAAAGGGFYGTPYDEERRAELANSLANSDYEQYRNAILGIQSTGLEGQQGYSNRGFEANKYLSDILGNLAQQRAGLAFQGRAQSNQFGSDLLRMLVQGGATYAGGSAGGRT